MATEPDAAPASIDYRKQLHDIEIELVAKLGPPPSMISEKYTTITTRDGHILDAKLWTPTNKPASDRPLIVLFHGGGYHCGSPEMCTLPAREFAKVFGAVVIAPKYRLAPEHKFPQAITDGTDVVRWLSENAAAELGCDLTKGFVVGGFSAGGNLSAVLASQPLDLKYPITGSFPSIPLLVVKEIVPSKYLHMFTSREDNVQHNGGLNEWEREFIPNKLCADVHSPLFSPVNAPLSQLKANVPRTFIQTGDQDVLRDDGAIYAKILEEAGVECRLYCQAKQDHQAYTIWFDQSQGSPKELWTETMKGIAWLLRTQWQENA